ncbi:MAG: nucleotidyl transferase AbiEii/AbiGii toxin family protein [Acidimicrobiales bacterium]
MLSPLQELVAAIVSGLEEADGFALAGGAALIVRGEIDRRTRDLDFFGLSAAAVDRLAPVAEQALRRAGLDVERVLGGSGFARLVVTRADQRTEVDLASDARLFPAERAPDGLLLLSRKELAVDKLLAVFGRAEARDFVDLLAIERHFGLSQLFGLAAEKDRGFTPELFAEMTERFTRLRRDEFPIDDGRYQELERAVREWRGFARALSPEHERGIDEGRDRGAGTGLGP